MLQVDDFSKICRTCLLEMNDLQNIYQTSLNEILMEFAAINVVYNNNTILQIQLWRFQVHIGDGLPEHLCPKCITTINEVISFKNQCKKSDERLRELLKDNEAQDDYNSFHDNEAEEDVIELKIVDTNKTNQSKRRKNKNANSGFIKYLKRTLFD